MSYWTNKNYSAVIAAKRAGLLTHYPCERCGADKTHAHHDDYSKPLAVMWLCPRHHRQRHRELGWGIKGRKDKPDLSDIPAEGILLKHGNVLALRQLLRCYAKAQGIKITTKLTNQGLRVFRKE